MENFKTTDIRLASFLRASGCEMIDLVDEYLSNKYEFVFKHSEILDKFLINWHYPENDIIKNVLYQHTLLKKAIKDKKLTI